MDIYESVTIHLIWLLKVTYMNILQCSLYLLKWNTSICEIYTQNFTFKYNVVNLEQVSIFYTKQFEIPVVSFIKIIH